LIVPVLALAACERAGIADETPAANGAPRAADVAVLLTPARPVFLRLSVKVDGAPVSQFREKFCTRWFTQFDADKNGSLSEEEAAKIPPRPGTDGAPAETKHWKSLDVDPADGKATLQEFRAFADAFLGPLVAAELRKPKADDAAGLFQLLDLDGDGSLTQEELGKSRAALARLDADDDETISVREIQTAMANRAASDGGSAGAQPPPLAMLGGANTAESIAERLILEYDGLAGNSGDGFLDHDELGLSPETLRPFDADQNGKLAVGELARLITELPPQIELSAELFEQQRGRPKLSATAAAKVDALQVAQSAADSTTLTLGPYRVALLAKRTRSSSGDNARFYALRFRIVDKDKNNYLDADEFTKLDLPETEFDEVDADGNEQIVEGELSEYLNRQSLTPLNQVRIEVADESRTLIDLLDTRVDQRLSPRELLSAARLLAEIDGNKDGRVTRGELTTRINVEIEIRRPAVERTIMVPPMSARAAAVAVPRDRGPEWFLRMDRNYDGDVSLREFLGPRSVFEKLDADHDGLLSPDEAEQAK